MKKSGLITPARKIEDKNENDIFIEMLKNTQPTPTNKNYSKINDILTEKGRLIFSREKKAIEAFDSKTIKELESLL